MSPSEALGAFTEYLDRRFREMGADFQNKLLDGMKWEDKLLNQYNAKNRLSEWLRTALEHAQQEVSRQDVALDKLVIGLVFQCRQILQRRAIVQFVEVNHLIAWVAPH